MGLSKGNTNNPNGRPEGTKNKKTKQWDALGESIITKHADRFNTLLSELDNDEFIKAYTSIIGYFKPKMQHSEIDATNKNTIEYKNVSKQFPDK